MMSEPVLFKPSEDLVHTLFRYHKARKKGIKRKVLPRQLVLEVQKEIGYSFRRALVVFGYEVLFMPITLCSVIETGTAGFNSQLNKILQKYLDIMSDTEGLKIVERLAEEFKDWLKEIGESLEAEEENWPYTRVYLMDNGNVIMNMNQKSKVAIKIH